MLTEKTLDQILGVLELAERYFRTGLPASKAYQKAVKDIAQRYSVRYQTIADGCSRRLNLDTVEVFIGLLKEWFAGNSHQLKALLIKNISELDEYKVENFFDHNSPAPSNQSTQLSSRVRNVEEATEVISFKTPRNLAGQLRALAELKNKNLPEFVNFIIKEYLDLHYVEFVSNLINSLPLDRKEKILRDMANQLK